MSAEERAAARIEASRGELVALSHFIHEHPELGYEEFVSSDAVANAA